MALYNIIIYNIILNCIIDIFSHGYTDILLCWRLCKRMIIVLCFTMYRCYSMSILYDQTTLLNATNKTKKSNKDNTVISVNIENLSNSRFHNNDRVCVFSIIIPSGN